MGDVIADAIERFLEWYERDFGVRYSQEDLKGTKLHAIVPEENKKTVQAIMFSASHNLNETQYERLDNWLDAEKLFDLERW
jgi:5'(3')-deoxyribonucleotidase